MRNTVAFALSIFLFIPAILSAQTLNRVDSVKVDQANIWGVLAEANEHMGLTVSRGNIIYFQYINEAMQRVGDPVAVISENDGLPKIVDHKTVFWKGAYYVSFSSAGDKQLYLVKLNAQGQRVGDIVTVWDQDTRPSNEPGKPTNDMILITTPDVLYVGHFQPANQHYIHGFDADLNRVSDPFLTDGSLPHNNVGGGLYVNEKIHLFTGSMFGGESDLIVTEWDKDFQPAAQEPRTLIDSESGNANWFATGVAHDEQTGYWYVGYQHLYEGEVLDEEHVDLAVFDRCFNLIYREHVTAQRNFRPHLLIKGNYLYMTYDQAGGGVFMHKYDLLEEGFGSTECGDDGKGGGQNDVPIQLDNNSFAESAEEGTAVGKFFIEGATEDITYTLVAGEGDTHNSMFSISADELLTAAVFNYEDLHELSIRVKATAGDQSAEKQFDIIVENVIEHSLSITGTLAFASTEVGESSSLSITLTHTGEDDGLEISNITVPDGFSVNKTSATLNVEEEVTIEVTFSPTEAKTYSGNLEITSSAGSQQLAVSGTGEMVLGLETEPEWARTLELYPQPATEMVNLKLGANNGAYIQEVRLLNALGEPLVQQAINNQKATSLNMAEQPSGVYVVWISTNLGLIKKRLLKQ
ncbi:T9SS type A sorting domain-containing protein [Roseivirga thermotolerans]|uniref:T9SS type A sorting domain-containing protein n=1 Tax=Roseivirga thermotolerans TaxID=1758176 RepID=UPI00273EFC69|nr:T9SS type A sorting domain-containing protein [Roseivirga thermotolerans]